MFKTIRFAIGAVLTALIALLVVAVAMWAVIGIGVVKGIQAWKGERLMPGLGSKRRGGYIDV